MILATIFTLFQDYEYLNAPFNISDGIYGSTFYIELPLYNSEA
jgi:heme/copper-type cytochrome/quinol oxidase subunit 3